MNTLPFFGGKMKIKKSLKLLLLPMVLALIVSILFNLVSCGNDSASGSETEISNESHESTIESQKDSDSIPDNTQSSSEEEYVTESSTETETSENTETISESETTEETQAEDETEVSTDNCYVALVETSNLYTPEVYSSGKEVPAELSDIFYSCDEPLGKPLKDGTGSIWITFKPTEAYIVDSLDIEGTYSGVENIGNDTFKISGVGSNLNVKPKTKKLSIKNDFTFSLLGYNIDDDGHLFINWESSNDIPLRFLEITTNINETTNVTYVEAFSNYIDVLTLEQNVRYKVYVRPVGYDRLGVSKDFRCAYIPSAKTIDFPRVEITTKDYILPTYENAPAHPAGCWGSSIINNNYEQCTINIYKNNELVYSSYEGDGPDDFEGAKIKIRGNTSAKMAKSPYKIKLSKKADLLEPLIGRSDDKSYADKNWLLLNYGSEYYRLAGDAIADAVGTAWSPDYCYVSLFVNGDYVGLYVLSESVKQGNGEGENQSRVPVDDDGFVIECDAYWWNEDLTFSTPLTDPTPMHFTFKYPDPDSIDENSESYQYIKQYLTDFEIAFQKNDDSYLEYIDLDSFVRWLLVADYLQINDGGGSNIFMYKKDSSDETKLCMGPNWDFDSYMKNSKALATIRMDYYNAPFYYRYLLKKDSFKQRYNELFNETKDKLMESLEDAYSKIDVDAYNELLALENIRQNTNKSGLDVQKNTFYNWLREHINWMKTQV